MLSISKRNKDKKYQYAAAPLRGGYSLDKYDDANRLSGYSYSGAGLPVRNQSYTYSTETGLLSTATLGTGETATYVYDGLERVSGVNVTGSNNAAVYAVTYGYADPSGTTEGNTTELISDLTYTRGGTTLLDLNYTYDSMGRISSDGTYTYTYDALGQLKTVKNSSGATVASYTYDGAGNILTATENGETVNYTYGNSNWADLLTAYDGSAITYDEIGNPTNYRGWTFGWDNGRQLTSASSGDNTLSYTYDVNGIRKSKTVNGVEHSYIYNGSQLLLESFGTTRLEFLYDVNGLPYALRHSTNSGSSYTTYYYILNQQGDVVALMNGSGSIVVRYTYDAWGKVTSVTNHSGAAITSGTNVANVNPIRYRGYYYDTDTSLYYVSNRYYDPDISRFINADTTDILIVAANGLTDKNLFSYCDNNPVMRADYGGELWHIAVGAVVGGLIGVVGKMASNIVDGNSITDGLVTAGIFGAVNGALATSGVGIVGMAAGSAAISMAENAAGQIDKNGGFNNFDVGDMVIDGVIGGVSGAMGGAGKGTKHLMNLGKQTVKRTVGTTINKGVRAGVREAAKAAVYYGKNTSRYYKSYFKNTVWDTASAVITSVASSNYMKNQYRRVLGR